MNIQQIAKTLGKYKRKADGGYMCQCPAHADRNPSLSLSLGPENKLLWKCFGGCDQEAVFQAFVRLGIFEGDGSGILYSNKKAEEYARTIAKEAEEQKTLLDEVGRLYGPVDQIYVYRDSEGVPIYYRALKISEGSKKIYPFHRASNGTLQKGEPEWAGSLKPLYGLERVAARRSSPVWVVEGEKCALALYKHGEVAVTSGGATSASRADWEPLRNREVIIWPDNDAAGKQYAEDVKKALTGIASKIDVVDLQRLSLPEKGDCVDWLRDRPEASGSDFRAIPTEIPALKVYQVHDLLDYVHLDIPPRDEVLSPWLLERSINMVAAWRGIGKTQFSLSLAMAVSSGSTMWEGFDGDVCWKAKKARRVLYIDGEMDSGELQERLQYYLAGSQYQPPRGYFQVFCAAINPDGAKPNIATPEGQLVCEAWIEHFKSEVVIFDNLSCLKRNHEISENEEASFYVVKDWFEKLRARGLTVVFVHHTNKSGAQRGTSAKEDNLDVSLLLEAPREASQHLGARFTVTPSKIRGKGFLPFTVRLDEKADGGLMWVVEDAPKKRMYEEGDDELTEREEEIVELLEKGCTRNAICKTLKVSTRVVTATKKKAIRLGVLESKNEGENYNDTLF